MTDPLLDSTQVAEHLGLALSTVRSYRRDGRLPEPDVVIGRSPAWRRSTIDEWAANRPGQGHRADLYDARGRRRKTLRHLRR